MIESGNYRIQRVQIRVEHFGVGVIWERWQDRLDPYLCTQAVGTPTLTLRNVYNWEPFGKWRSVKTMVKGFNAMDVLINDKKETLWEFYRIRNREIYVRFWMSSAQDEIRLLCDNRELSGCLVFDLLDMLMPSVMLKNDIITFHGVLMEHDNCGIIISAPSGTGKTTHARLWRDLKRALIINGDRAACIKEAGDWVGFGIPWSGTSGECINRDVPLKAFVVLEQNTDNSVERLYGLDAFEAIMPNLIYPTWDQELAGKALDYVNDFLDNVPVFRLRCRPDVESVEVLDKALSEL